MISIFYVDNLTGWIVTWILEIIAYFFLLRKMDLDRRTAIIPFLAQRQFTKRLFRTMRSFYRPFVVAAVFLIAAFYLGPEQSMGIAFLFIAYVIYGIFLLRLYWRLGKAFGKGVIFRILMLLVPPLFLLILAFSRAYYRPLKLRPVKHYRGVVKYLLHGAVVLISAVEILVLVLGVGFITVRTFPPEILVNKILSDSYAKTKDVKATGKVVEREKAMGVYADKLASLPRSREHFSPDHSKDKNVVVMTYVVGSNLENRIGLASANIRQMKEATEQGEGLTFVMEAGGSRRWFTSGIDKASYGRYTIAGGDLKKVEDLPGDTCMSEEKSLKDFITWTKQNYPADRYMLVLWDHGGGLAYGYGQDDLNKREVEEGEASTIKVSELVNALRESDVKFDLIGFDACLMQDIEVAVALEPYADYFLASEETEGGFGWFYTRAFGKLAKDPGISTEKFGRELIACYDPYNTIIKDEDGKPDTGATLSLVDLTLARPAYEKLGDLFKKVEKAIRTDAANYAALAVAANNAYTFESDLQIDLIDFLKILDKGDYEDAICSHKDKMDVITALRACILYRNGNSAKGINGMAVALPYKNIEEYGKTSEQLAALSHKKEKKALDAVFSIIAAQKKKENDKKSKQEDLSFLDAVAIELAKDYTKESWYVKGFEEYADAKALVDIPLKEVEDGYGIELPKKAWKTIADCQTMVYQRTKDGPKGSTMRYLGSDHVGAEDAEGHPLISMDDKWVCINGNLVCYEAVPVKETKDGDVYGGTVRARLNNKENIILHIEWDPVREGQEDAEIGHVTGYELDTDIELLKAKGLLKLEAGDSIRFRFDYYDDEGNLVKTKAAGDSIRVTKQNRLKVTDEPLGKCDILFGGMLKDVYQRTLTTEQVEVSL